MWIEPGRIIKKKDVNSDDDKIDGTEYEENEIPKESFFPHIVKGSYVVLYSPPWASELFYLCKVLSCELQQHLSLMLMIILPCKVWNISGLIIWKKFKGKRTLSTINCFQKKNSLFSFTKQKFYPDVPLSEELTLDTKDYHFLSVCIWFNYLQFMTIILTFDS